MKMLEIPSLRAADLPEAVRPKPLNVVMVVIGAVTDISFALYTVGSKVAQWVG